MTQSRIKLVVLNEHTLGYIRPEQPNDCYIIRSSVIKGAVDNGFMKPICYALDKVRLASAKDFDEFRVVFTERGYNNSQEYEFAE